MMTKNIIKQQSKSLKTLVAGLEETLGRPPIYKTDMSEASVAIM